MAETVTIELPLPDRALSPNARVHWRKLANAKKRYREIAFHAASQAQRDWPRRWERARLEMAFYWPTRRRRDVDNAIASMKSAIDGIVDAGVVVDDSHEHLVRGETRFECDPDMACVLLHVTKLGANDDE